MFRQKTFLFVMVFVAILAVASVVFASVEGFTLTFNPTASISPSKTMLTVSGTVTCPLGLSVNGIILDAFQQRGNRQMSASRYASFSDRTCTGTPMSWTAVVGFGNQIVGLWQPGPVTVMATAELCHLVPDPYGWEENQMICEEGSYERLILDGRIHAGQ